jgi:membrane associated rhomboid family serine protease
VLIPLTHENTTARRWPIVTTTIVVACLACFLVTLTAQQGARDAIENRGQIAADYWQSHPYLQLRPPLDQLAARGLLRAKHAEPPPSDPDDLAVQQKYLDDRCADVEVLLDSMPARRFGVIPAAGVGHNAYALVTSLFMHGGWLHIIFNMWFLWLCGCNLEDRWGRGVFTAFYLTAGIASGLVHIASAPQSTVAVIGASGAIAGAMGAFLVCFARTRIRFAYILFIRPRTFTAPAYVMLPLWGAWELASGLLWGTGDGVAHWAHVGGFFYGVAFALVLKKTGIDARLDEDVERAVSTLQDPRIMRAAELTTAGRAVDALAMLEAVASERPSDIDARLEMLRAAKAAGDAKREAAAYGSLVRLYLEQQAFDTAYDLFAEAQPLGHDAAVQGDVRVRLADHFLAEAKAQRAWALYDSVTRSGLVDAVAVRAALAQAKMARSGGRLEERRRLLDAVLESPFSTPQIDESARAELAAMDA